MFTMSKRFNRWWKKYQNWTGRCEPNRTYRNEKISKMKLENSMD